MKNSLRIFYRPLSEPRPQEFATTIEHEIPIPSVGDTIRYLDAPGVTRLVESRHLDIHTESIDWRIVVTDISNEDLQKRLHKD